VRIIGLDARAWLIRIIGFAALLLLLSPFFWAIYRTMAFNTLPRDDYAPFLLWLVRSPGGAFPGSPWGYRILSVAAAVPFYYIVPPLRLSELPASIPAAYLKATAAIALLSWLAMVLAGFAIFQVATRQCGLGKRDGLLAAALLFLLCWHSQVYGIDPFAIMLVALAVAVLHRRGVFAALVIVSVVADEKVCLVLFLWLTIRVGLHAEDRRELRVQWAATVLALVLYVLMLRLVHLPGNDYQVQPHDYTRTMFANLAASVSGRGLLLDIVPSLLVAGAAVAGWPVVRAGWLGRLFRPTDALVIPALILVALVVTKSFDIGRVVMHAAPLYVVPAVGSLSHWSRWYQGFARPRDVLAPSCRAKVGSKP
jgi:hypothetical protein